MAKSSKACRANSRSKNSRLKKVQKCLSKLASKLIVKSYEDSNHLFWMMFLTIKASQLNTSDCGLAAQHPFWGILGRKKIGICDITSISLFIDDVECLLREEYGDVDSAALDKLLSALRTIVLNFTAYVRPDLSGEYYDAVNVDYINGIGVPKGYGLSSSDHHSAEIAAHSLAIRSLRVSVTPDSYSSYTNEFIKTLKKSWPDIGGTNCSSEDDYYELV